MASPYKILILGASYGSLLATKFLLAGQTVSIVGSAREAKLIARQGTVLRVALKRQAEPVEIDSRKLPGSLNAITPDAADPNRYDLICLAIQEPHYGSPLMRDLISKVAASKRPVLSIMNIPPPPYLARIPALDIESLESCYSDPRIWNGFAPNAFTQAAADPQAFRPQESANMLEVTHAANFKVAHFDDPAHTAILFDIAAAVEEARYILADGSLSEVPVKLRMYDSVFAPLGKWSMLLTGNYRCIQAEGTRSIRDAVYADLEVSQNIYNWTNDVLLAIGAQEKDIVPFDDYARAALDLTAPSSIARALAANQTEIERVDLLVQAIAASKGMRNPHVDAITERVDAWLRRCRDRGGGI
jgi:ketopantoate reductase